MQIILNTCLYCKSDFILLVWPGLTSVPSLHW